MLLHILLILSDKNFTSFNSRNSKTFFTKVYPLKILLFPCGFELKFCTFGFLELFKDFFKDYLIHSVNTLDTFCSDV